MKAQIRKHSVLLNDNLSDSDSNNAEVQAGILTSGPATVADFSEPFVNKFTNKILHTS